MTTLNYKKAKFHGAICPSILPFSADGKIDLKGLEAHFKRLTDSGINGILLMGTIGEFVTTSMAERLELIKVARQMTDLPVIVHVSTTVVDDMVRLADAAFENNYEAVMALPHYYYAQTPNQLFEYYKFLDSKFAGDWLIYNFPARTGCDVNAALVSKLIKECPKFVGIKDTVDCASHTRDIVNAALPLREDFSVLGGFDEYLVPNLFNGGAGVLSGLNNVVPELFAQVVSAFEKKDMDEVAKLYKEITRLSGIYAIGDDFVTTIKTAVSRKFGYMEPLSRNFAGKLNAAQLAELDKLFNL